MSETAVPVVCVLAGLALLGAGGEVLVRAAARLAAAARISPLVIGLTVVAFGTSAPELAVTLQASLAGEADLAVGNVVGSNILNVLLILGLAALVAPMKISARLIWQDVPLVVLASVLVWLLGFDGRIGRWDGALLVCGLAAYIAWSIRQGRKESRAVREEFQREFAPEKAGRRRIVLLLAQVLAGLAMLTLGSRWLVEGAVVIARLLGVGELLIGLTVVAVGTSLPEAVTSVVATRRGEGDIAVGNIVGSNLFNILGVLGLGAVAAPGGIPVSGEALSLDIPVMIAVAVACLPIFFTGRVVSRWEGGLLLAYYLAYTAYVIFRATSPEWMHRLGWAMAAMVFSLTAVALLIAVVRAMRASGRSR